MSNVNIYIAMHAILLHNVTCRVSMYIATQCDMLSVNVYCYTMWHVECPYISLHNVTCRVSIYIATQCDMSSVNIYCYTM